MSIKNYIFDFGQVVVHFELEYMTAAYIKNKADIELAAGVIFDRLYWDRLDEGTISDDEVRAEIRRRLPERLHSAAMSVYDNWYRNIPFIEGVPELMRELKANGSRVYILSNISKQFAEGYKDVPELRELIDGLDGAVFSAPIGLIKPNAEIFGHLLNRYALLPDECLFIDDNAKNIRGAEAVGINAYLFDGNVDALAEFIKNK